MAILTFAELRRLSAGQEEQLILKRATIASGKTVFLSYSSKDAEFRAGAVAFLEKHGGSVYVDIGDDRLPQVPSYATSESLRKNIRDLPRLVVMVSPNSKDS